ncbi:MAG: hypothetical protein R3C59_31480 [Planctomycetaceae bacterium]
MLEQVGRSEQPLPLAWNAVFRDQKIGSTVLELAFIYLHQQQRYDDVVEGIQAAIRNDHAQPWMYDVLAIEMKLAKRPQKEIDRVLLSRVDFAPDSETQMLITASTLAGFDAFDEAMRLCREAAKRNPWQSAVWSTARNIAGRSKDPEATIWAHSGTIKHVWEKDYATLHAESAAILEDLRQQLADQNKTELATKAQQALADARQRDLRLKILWTGDADLDLSVVEPGGRVCSRSNPLTGNSGILIQQTGGGKALGRGQKAEQYVCVEGLSGEYQLKVRYISGRLTLGKVIVQVTRYENSDQQVQQTQTFDSVVDQDLTVKVLLTNGRRSP